MNEQLPITIKTLKLLPIKSLSTLKSAETNFINFHGKSVSTVKNIKAEDKERLNNFGDIKCEKSEDSLMLVGYQSKGPSRISLPRNINFSRRSKPILALYEYINNSALGLKSNENNMSLMPCIERESKAKSLNNTIITNRISENKFSLLNNESSSNAIISRSPSLKCFNELNTSIYNQQAPFIISPNLISGNNSTPLNPIIHQSLPNLRATKGVVDKRDSPIKFLLKGKFIKEVASDKGQENAIVIEANKKRLKPKISAKAWSITDGETGRLLYGKKEHDIREIASLTKIMTCLVTLKWMEKLKKSLQLTILKVSGMAASMIGTTANLRAGDELTVWDLLHGLMLPSGNDAAYCLAENIGGYIYQALVEANNEKLGRNSDEKENRGANPLRYFIREMNYIAKELGLSNTLYTNPHGLMHKYNRSTAADIGKLCYIAMKDPLIKQIVNNRSYCALIQSSKGNPVRELIWENTNKLLDEGFDGIKTGTTNTAGPCLAASQRRGNHHLIVVVLNSKTSEHRWKEVKKLMKWAYQIKT